MTPRNQDEQLKKFLQDNLNFPMQEWYNKTGILLSEQDTSSLMYDIHNHMSAMYHSHMTTMVYAPKNFSAPMGSSESQQVVNQYKKSVTVIARSQDNSVQDKKS